MPASGANRSWTARLGITFQFAATASAALPRVATSQSPSRGRATTTARQSGSQSLRRAFPWPARATTSLPPCTTPTVQHQARARPSPPRHDLNRHHEARHPTAHSTKPSGRISPRATTSQPESPPSPRYNLLHRGGTRHDGADRHAADATSGRTHQRPATTSPPGTTASAAFTSPPTRPVAQPANRQGPHHHSRPDRARQLLPRLASSHSDRAHASVRNHAPISRSEPQILKRPSSVQRSRAKQRGSSTARPTSASARS
jgi:hypothetical protein